jgi:4-hydroxybenzoate polyprenyltransferase
LPSGQVSPGAARAVGLALLLAGVVLAAVAGWLPGVTAALPWRAAVVAALLALSVVLYDGVLKQSFVGPIFMGLCRFFNVLLGMSLAAEAPGIFDAAGRLQLHFTQGQLIIAAAIGVYVLGITLFARREAHAGHQAALFQATVVMALGIAMLVLLPGRVPQSARAVFAREWIWPLLLVLLALSIGRRCVAAIFDPQPARIQGAVKFALLSIITLDAAVALWAAGPYHALAIFLLVIPAMALGKFVYST